MIGKRFGRLVVTARTSASNRVICLCECGKESAAWTANLYAGKTKSCGCGSVVKKTHGHSRHSNPTYLSWVSMKARCKPGYSDPAYAGVTLCERWRSFENFLADMGERPEGKTLDRRDNSRGYEPDNCRWATLIEQGNNRHNVRRFDWRGRSMTISEIANAESISASRIRNRLNIGWTLERAVSTAGFNRGKRSAYSRTGASDAALVQATT